MVLDRCDIYKDEDELLKDRFYGLKGLKRQHGRLTAHFGRALRSTLQAQFAFCLMLAAFAGNLPKVVSWLFILIALVELWALFMVMAVFAASLYFGRLWKRRPRKAMIYWAWWPGWDLFFCLFGVISGALVGHYLWYTGLEPYYEIAALQPYDDVNPALVPGSQLQDAGAINFADNVDVDRSSGGCFVNAGHTYCVAPIVYTGQLHSGLGNAPMHGSWDYFAVGIDCCTCPNQDFRCGEWRNPLARGGLRSIDFRSRPFYRLAVEDFIGAFQKESQHPLFFDWVEEPNYKVRALWHWAAHSAILVAVAFFPVVFFVAVAGGQVLYWLVAARIASPHDTPGPPEGLENAWATWIPEVLAHYEEERKQLLALPISPTPWYGASPPPPGAIPAEAPQAPPQA